MRDLKRFIFIGISFLVMLGFFYKNMTDKNLGPSLKSREQENEASENSAASKSPAVQRNISNANTPAAVDAYDRVAIAERHLHANPQIETGSLEKIQSPLFPKNDFLLINNVEAISAAQYAVKDDSFMTKVGGFVILKNQNFVANPSNLSKDSNLVAYNARMNRLGVVTGTLKIEMDKDDLSDVIADHDLSLIQAFPEIKSFFVSSSSSPFDLIQLKKSLEQDARIISVQLEVIEKVYEKR